MDVYIARGDKKRGPVSRDAVIAWARSGLIKSDDLIWAPGMSSWTKALAVPFLTSFFPSTQPPVPVPTAVSAPDAGNINFYYVARDDKPIGPFNEDQMLNYIAAGKLVMDDKVYDIRTASWHSARDLWSFPNYVPKPTLETPVTSRQDQVLPAVTAAIPFTTPSPTVTFAESAPRPALKHTPALVDAAQSSEKVTIASVVAASDEDDHDGVHFLLAIAISLILHSTLLMSSVLSPPKMPVDVIEEQAIMAAALVVKEPPKEDIKVETQTDEIKVVTGTGKGTGGGGKSTGGGGKGGSDFSSRGLLALVGSAGDGNLTDWVNSGGNIDGMVGNFGGITLNGESTQGRGNGQGGGFGGGNVGDLLAGGGDLGMPSTANLSRSARVRADLPGVSGVGSASGNRDPKAIYRVVSSYDSALKARYVFYLKSNPKLKGRVVISFTIAADGTVTRASVVNNSTGNPSLGNDISGIIRRMRFGAIDRGDVTVQYPFSFEPGN